MNESRRKKNRPPNEEKIDVAPTPLWTVMVVKVLTGEIENGGKRSISANTIVGNSRVHVAGVILVVTMKILATNISIPEQGPVVEMTEGADDERCRQAGAGVTVTRQILQDHAVVVGITLLEEVGEIAHQAMNEAGVETVVVLTDIDRTRDEVEVDPNQTIPNGTYTNVVKLQNEEIKWRMVQEVNNNQGVVNPMVDPFRTILQVIPDHWVLILNYWQKRGKRRKRPEIGIDDKVQAESQTNMKVAPIIPN